MALYVGAGRWTGGSASGLFRRISANAPWVRMDLPETAQVHAVTVDPQRSHVAYAATDVGLYRTQDAGERWEQLAVPDNLQVWSVYIHPRDPRLIFAGTSPLAVLRSADGGATWKRFDVNVAARVTMAFPCRVMRFAADPVRTDRLFAALEVGGVMRSDDGGETWNDCADDLVRLADQHPKLRSRIQSDSETEGMLDAHAIAISSARPDAVLLAVRMGVFQSEDEGGHWQDLDIGRFSPLTYARDIRVSSHDPKVLFTCLSPASRSEDGSLYRSDNLGKSWVRIDRGIKARATMMAVAQSAHDAAEIHCISRHGQVFSTADGGTTWSESIMPQGVLDLYAVACA